jgi:hypothetical protein
VAVVKNLKNVVENKPVSSQGDLINEEGSY